MPELRTKQAVSFLNATQSVSCSLRSSRIVSGTTPGDCLMTDKRFRAWRGRIKRTCKRPLATCEYRAHLARRVVRWDPQPAILRACMMYRGQGRRPVFDRLPSREEPRYNEQDSFFLFLAQIIHNFFGLGNLLPTDFQPSKPALVSLSFVSH